MAAPPPAARRRETPAVTGSDGCYSTAGDLVHPLTRKVTRHSTDRIPGLGSLVPSACRFRTPITASSPDRLRVRLAPQLEPSLKPSPARCGAYRNLGSRNRPTGIGHRSPPSTLWQCFGAHRSSNRSCFPMHSTQTLFQSINRPPYPRIIILSPRADATHVMDGRE